MKRQRKTFVWILAATVCLLAITFTGILVYAAGNEDGTLKTVYTFTKSSKYFKKIELTVISAKEGYSRERTAQEENILSLHYDFKFDDGELWNRSEELSGETAFPVRDDMTQEKWMQAMRDWFDGHPEVDGVEFRHSIDSADGLLVSRNIADTPVTAASGEEIGRYRVRNGELTVVFDPVVYFMSDIDFSVNVEAIVDAAGLADEDIEIVVGEDGALKAEKLGTWEQEQAQAEPSDYEISKNGPEKTDGVAVTYTIDVRAQNGKSLGGKQMAEMVPAGMVIDHAEVSIDGSAAADITGSMPDNIYTFPDGEMTSAHFTVTLTLDEEKIAEYYENGIVETFRNKAQLRDSEQAAPLAESNTVATTVRASFIVKYGESLNDEKTAVRWTVDVSTCLPYLDYGYIVDRLCADDHMYEFDKGVTVKTDDKEYTISPENITEITGAYNADWDELRAEDIYAAGGGRDFLKPHAYYYYRDTEETNLFAEQEGREYKRDCYLVIPFYGLHGTGYDTKDITIEYTTCANMHGLEKDAYWNAIEDYFNEEEGREYSKNAKNDVTLVWKNVEGGRGVLGTVIPELVRYSKRSDTDPSVIIKSGIRYNASTMMSSWEIEVDRLGFAVNDVLVTDELDADVFDAQNAVLTLTEKTLNTTEKQERTLVKGTDYTVDDTGLVSISLGSIPDGKSYTIGIEAKVISPELLSVQDKDAEINNNAHIYYTLDGKHRDFGAQAGIPAPNTLLEKSPVGVYDRDEKTLKWSVTFGKNGLTLNNGVVTDILPQGFEYVEGSAAITPNDVAFTEARDGNGRVRFILSGATDKQHTITFATRATQKWIDENLIYSESNRKAKTVTNTATLNGTVLGMPVREKDGTEGITVTAVNSVPVEPIGKTGVYDKKHGKISWTITVNDAHYTLDDAVLREELSDVLELVPSTVRITADGGNGDGAEITTCGDSLLEIHFLPGGNTQRYTIRFDTLLTGDAAGAKIRNIVNLYDGNGGLISLSEESDGGYDGSYIPADDSNAHLRPNLHIHKMSSNSEQTGNTSDGTNSLRLPQAEFSLDAYEYTLENGVLTLADEKTEKYSKARITDANGDAYFGNIKTVSDNDRPFIFLLHETKAPAGYDRESGKSRLVYFRRSYEESDFDDLSSVSEIRFAENGENKVITDSAAIAETLLIQEAEEGGGWITLNGYFVNAPNANRCLMDKMYRLWDSFESANGTYAPVGAGIEFAVTRSDGSHKLRTVTVVTDENGVLTFDDLDPGTYAVTEKNPPYGMMPGSFELKVECVDAVNDLWTHTASEMTDGHLKVVSDENGVHLLNEPQLTDLTLYKYEKYTAGSKEKQPIKNVSIHLRSVTPENDAAIPAGVVDRTVKTDSKGKAYFTALPVGTYEIYEVIDDSVKGYEAALADDDILLGRLEITQNAAGELEKTMRTEGEGYVTFTADGFTVYNKPVKGSLHFDKRSVSALIGTLDGTPIADVKFGLYRLTNNQIYSPPAYSAFTDEDGNLDFTNVEYGDYYLREMVIPAGYDRTAANNTFISRSKMIFTDDKSSFTYVHGKTIENSLHAETVSFTKVDDDERRIADVTFDVYRRGEQRVEENGEGYAVTVPDNVTAYYSYKDMTVTTDENGQMSLRLPYGDYLLKERTAPLNLRNDYCRVAVMLEVRTDGTKAYEYSSGLDLPFEENGGSYTVEETSGTAWTALDETEGNYNVLNKRRFGFIQLRKVAADKHSDGTVTAYESSPLAGKSFGIYLDGELYVTVKTDETGSIIRTGETYSGRHLWYGTYTIRELDAPDIPEARFTVDDSTTDDGGTVWISYDGKAQPKTDYIAPDEPVTGAPFVNMLERCGISVKKTNSSGRTLKGACFSLYSGSKTVDTAKIADIADDGSGSYIITSLERTDSRGVPYLTDGRLLTGTYTLKETTAPEGYLPAGDIEIKVTGENACTVRMTANGIGTVSLKDGVITVTDERIQRDIVIRKVYEGTDTPIPGVVFELYKEDGTAAVTATTDMNGIAVFTSVKKGEYIMREDYEESLKADAPDDVYIDVDATAKVEVGADAEERQTELYVNGTLIGEDDTVTIENKRLSADIRLVKHDADNTAIKLKGVEFKLEKRRGKTYEAYGGNDGVYTTDKNGVLSVTGLVRGSYRLTEIKTVDGYTLSGTDALTFDIENSDNGKTLEVNNKTSRFTTASKLITDVGIGNRRVFGRMTLVKRSDDERGSALNGVLFTLTRLNDGRSYALETGYSYGSPDDTAPTKAENGVLTVEGLDWGDYVLRETKSLKGYTLDVNEKYPFTVGYVDGKLTTEHDLGTVVNRRNRVTIVKTDAKTGKPLAGAVFEVVNAKDDAERYTVVTDENGRAVLTGKITGGEEYIIREKTAPDGYRLSNTQIRFVLGTDGTAGKENKDNIFTFTNEKITGTLLFAKRAGCAMLGGIDGKPVAGAEFELRSSVEGQAVLTAVSDKNGIIRFDGVTYGDYDLFEVKTPEGYIGTNEAVRHISKDELNVIGSVFEADFTDEAIYNRVITGNIGILKTEINDGVMPGVTFDVYRRGSESVSTDGGQLEMVPDADLTTYYPYGPCASVTTDKNGRADINVPVGDYLLVERTEGMGLVDEAKYNALLAQVTPEGTAAWLYASGTKLEAAGNGYDVSMDENWKKTEEKNGAFGIINEKKHFKIDLQKIAGDITETGKSIYYEDAPLGGVEFILEQRNGSEPVLVLRTETNGHIATDNNGETYSGRYIRCGEYVLTEKNTGISCAFTVDENVRNGATFWFEHDGKTVKCVVDAAQEDRRPFMNSVKRHTVRIEKCDAADESIHLENAVFDLLTADGSRAAVIKNGTISDCDARNGNNIPYCAGGKLLSGKYILRETHAPEGYYPTGDVTFTVAGNGEVTVESGTAGFDGSAVKVFDEKIVCDVRMMKVYTGSVIKEQNVLEVEPIACVVFVLCDKDGTPVTSADGSLITAETDKDGMAVFTDVPAGSYIIRESYELSQKAGASSDIFIDDEKLIRFTVKAEDDLGGAVAELEDGNDGVKSVNGLFLIENERISATVKLTMTDPESGNRVIGATFELTRCTGEPETDGYTKYDECMTDINGEAAITIHDRGAYILAETSNPAVSSVDELPSISFVIDHQTPGTVLEVCGGEDWFTPLTGKELFTADGILSKKKVADANDKKDNAPDDEDGEKPGDRRVGDEQTEYDPADYAPDNIPSYTGGQENVTDDNGKYVTDQAETPVNDSQDVALITPPATGEAQKTSSPGTGDNVDTGILLAILGISMTAMFIAVFSRRKKA